MSFEFNGEQRSYLTIDKSEARPSFAPVRREWIEVPGRAGSILTRSKTEIRKISIPVNVFYGNFTELQEIKTDLAKWLVHEQEKKLVFPDEPGRSYNAILDGGIDFDELLGVGKGIITFICLDPYKYAPPKSDTFNNGIVTVSNNGTAPTPPVYEIDVLEDITHLDIISDESYIRIGEPAPASEPVYARQTLVLSDSLKTLIGWSDVTNVDNGYVAGTMTATQAGFTATGFGTELSPRRWQGPAKRKSLPRPVQNFQMIATVDLLNVAKQTGMIEIYCLDAFGNTVAKVGIEDIMQSVAEIQAKFQLGNVANRKVQHYVTADYKPAWNNYTGVLRLFRDGNRFRPYFGLVQPDGRHVWVASKYLYTDVAGDYAAPITQIQIAERKWPGTTEAVMRVRDLKVWELNDPVEGLPYLARAGDKIIIDTKESVVLLNGEPIQKDFFSDYFDLEPGQTTLLMQPADKVSGKVIVTERYL